MDFLYEGGEAVERAIFERVAAKERADVLTARLVHLLDRLRVPP